VVFIEIMGVFWHWLA